MKSMSYCGMLARSQLPSRKAHLRGLDHCDRILSQFPLNPPRHRLIRGNSHSRMLDFSAALRPSPSCTLALLSTIAIALFISYPSFLQDVHSQPPSRAITPHSPGRFLPNQAFVNSKKLSSRSPACKVLPRAAAVVLPMLVRRDGLDTPSPTVPQDIRPTPSPTGSSSSTYTIHILSASNFSLILPRDMGGSWATLQRRPSLIG